MVRQGFADGSSHKTRRQRNGGGLGIMTSEDRLEERTGIGGATEFVELGFTAGKEKKKPWVFRNSKLKELYQC